MINKILIVDDEVDIVDISQRSLQRSGYEVYKAYNGKEAFDIATAMLPDIIVTDVTMPILNGFEFCKLLKKQEITKNIPVIVLTAHKHLEDSFLFLGIKDYLVKPFNPDALKLTIEKKLDYIRMMRTQRTKIVANASQGWVINSMDQLFALAPQFFPVCVNNSKDLCDRAASIGADIVLLDMTMGDMPLAKVLETLKHSPSLANTVLLLYYSPIADKSDTITYEAKIIEVQHLKVLISEYNIKEYLGAFDASCFIEQLNAYRKDK